MMKCNNNHPKLTLFHWVYVICIFSLSMTSLLLYHQRQYDLGMNHNDTDDVVYDDDGGIVVTTMNITKTEIIQTMKLKTNNRKRKTTILNRNDFQRTNRGNGLKINNKHEEETNMNFNHDYNTNNTMVTTPMRRTTYDGNNSTTVNGKFAYAYVVGGCDPDNPAYRYYIYDIIISTYNQRIENTNNNSNVDVIILFQMYSKSVYNQLPESDIRLLNLMNIKFYYIPKSNMESFYRIMLDKFRILDLINYDRILFIDSDVMAIHNLNYLFHLSMNGILKENIIFAGVKEPANGGIFMLSPKNNSWNTMINIIYKKEELGKLLPYPHWNITIGWGHVMNHNDGYQLIGSIWKRGKIRMEDVRHNTWNFYGAFADQGLLYHWVKYVEKSVSIIFKDEIQNWDIDPNNTDHVILQETLSTIDVFNQINRINERKDYNNQRLCWKAYLNKKSCLPPQCDIVHFTGIKKPWLHNPPINFNTNPFSNATNYWFHILYILNDKYNLNLDFNHWIKDDERRWPLLGMYPKHKEVATTEYYKTASKLLQHNISVIE